MKINNFLTEIQDCPSQLPAEMTKGTKKEFFFTAQLQHCMHLLSPLQCSEEGCYQAGQPGQTPEISKGLNSLDLKIINTHIDKHH